MSYLQSVKARILILALAHVTVDFYGGLTLPLPEPTLINHLGVGLAAVMTLIVASALLCNIVQPLSGALLPARGFPLLLIICPIAAAAQSMIGLTSSYWLTGALMLTSAAGIGLIHPEAALAVQSLGGRHRGLALSVFMSSGYFGFSLGGFISGRWAAARGLSGFWLLSLPALVLVALVIGSRLHKLEGHGGHQPPAFERHGISFLPIFLVAVCIAGNFCILVRMLPIYLVRQFGESAQVVAGDTILATGIAGAVGAWFWGHMSDKIGCGRTIAIAQIAGTPFIILIFRAADTAAIPFLGFGVGMTLGASFPLSVALARGARGFSQRARMGLCIGGAWGIAELFVQLGSLYIDRFEAGLPEPVLRVLYVCLFFISLTFIVSLSLARFEKRDKLRNQSS